jgi:chaperonin GroES
MGLQPFNEFVLVRKDPEVEEKTAGGLYKPDIAKLESNEGTVLAVGEGRWDGQKFVALSQKINDRVLFSRATGMRVNIDGEELWLFRADELYGKRTPDPIPFATYTPCETADACSQS